ncbi:hypothetical protein BC827DRAFT_1154283 [Russula dissimulans]|nr:hypothetical protein BC827DRAFT_1154283 [Russula dissimulans]
MDPTIFYPTASSREDGRCPAENNGLLKTKVPDLVDRLALRLLGSCNVTEQASDEDVDALAYPASYTSSESSFPDGDIDDDDHVGAPSPDRSPRRKLRRCAPSPYSRTGGKRKESWADADTGAGSRVPAFRLAGASELPHC